MLTTKQRAYLKSLASNLDATFQLGKSNLTPEYTKAIEEAFNTAELIKISVLKNCTEDPKEVAQTIADRTRSEVVQVIGRKIVLFKQNKDEKKRKIELPRVKGAKKED
ncbi:MAG: ribosome assembly RNA-binding protein YhbY [Lachnospiraceae bacterium]|nr:ribosome assembly RNA-binding protein YhbY [Lachnospiraceae bacterium]